MEDIKRGQRVLVLLKDEIIESTIKAVGYKYITLNNIYTIFDRRTLRKLNSYSSLDCIITDVEKYKNEQYNKGLICKIKSFQFEIISKKY